MAQFNSPSHQSQLTVLIKYGFRQVSRWANGLFITDWNFWKVGMEGNPWEGWLSEEVFQGQEDGYADKKAN